MLETDLIHIYNYYGTSNRKMFELGVGRGSFVLKATHWHYWRRTFHSLHHIAITIIVVVRLSYLTAGVCLPFFWSWDGFLISPTQWADQPNWDWRQCLEGRTRIE